MGLLDQVLGQVIGNMSGGGRAQGGAGGGLGDLLGGILGGGGAAQTGRRPAPGGGGGLGGMLGGAGGKLSPLLLAVLAILANKHLSTGAGGLGTILHDMLGGGRSQSPDDVPADHAGGERTGPFGGAMGGGDDFETEPYPPRRQGRATRDGGFLDEVGSMLDGPGGRQPAGGGTDDVLGGGFDDLQHRFERSGHGDLMGSWIGPGANSEPSPDDLERALGPQAIDDLSRRTGMDRGELLDQLSRALPQVVDGLTPDGRLPTAQEQSRWI